MEENRLHNISYTKAPKKYKVCERYGVEGYYSRNIPDYSGVLIPGVSFKMGSTVYMCTQMNVCGTTCSNDTTCITSYS